MSYKPATTHQLRCRQAPDLKRCRHQNCPSWLARPELFWPEAQKVAYAQLPHVCTMQPHNAVHAWVEQMQKHLNMTDVDHQQATNLAIGTFPVLCSVEKGGDSIQTFQSRKPRKDIDRNFDKVLQKLAAHKQACPCHCSLLCMKPIACLCMHLWWQSLYRVQGQG